VKLKVEWFKDCKNEDEKRERRETVISGLPLLEELQKIVKSRLDRCSDDRKKRKLYDSPNWALMQADITGAERELEELLDLLTIDKE
jgi:hypothetical protein